MRPKAGKTTRHEETDQLLLFVQLIMGQTAEAGVGVELYELIPPCLRILFGCSFVFHASIATLLHTLTRRELHKERRPTRACSYDVIAALQRTHTCLLR